MIDKTDSDKALQRLFRRFKVVDMKALFKTLKTKSRMSIFRRLKEMGYLSSYTHTGRYYTLAHIPQFDNHGLWFHQSVGFSQCGTLKSTMVDLVDRSSAGLTHLELNHILRIRTHNTLLNLVREGRMSRQRLEKTFLYVSVAPDKAALQVARRRKNASNNGEIASISVTTVIEVLIEAIHAGQVRIAPSVVAHRLSFRGISITAKQVKQIFIQYGISTEKKTAESGSKRLKP
jgi:hypothetical protein